MHAQARTSRKRARDKTFARAFTARTDVSVNGSMAKMGKGVTLGKIEIEETS